MLYELEDPKTKEKISYHIDNKLLYLLKDVKKYITRRDKDYVELVDGYEGSGKTTFALQMGKFVDPTLDLDRVCMTPDEFRAAILNAKKGQCVIYDEAVTGLTAGAAITRVGRILKELMMQMRQKNLFVIVIMPVIFEFNKYAVLSRARFSFHIWESKGRPGYWVGFNKKDTRMNYLLGKKTHSYKIRSRFNGRFYGKFALGESQEPLYRKKKEKALREAGEIEDEGVRGKKWLMQRNFAWYLLNKNKISHEKIENEYKIFLYPVSDSQIGSSIQEIKEILRKTRKTTSSPSPL